jgi:hypothetical protein
MHVDTGYVLSTSRVPVTLRHHFIASYGKTSVTEDPYMAHLLLTFIIAILKYCFRN